jgi:hypothetical protein
MKKIFLLFISSITFILSGTGEIKDINDTLQKEDLSMDLTAKKRNSI